jgi:hypothetical protein
MSRASILRAVFAFLAALAIVALALSQGGFPVVGAGIGFLVGVPLAFVDLVRALLPIVLALLVAAFAIRFGIRALRKNATLRGDLAQGGKLFAVTAWVAFAWLVVELAYRQLWLGWSTLYGNLGRSLVGSAVAVALCLVADRLVPWSRAPREVRHFGFLIVVAVGLLTAHSAWSHRHVVSHLALLPVAVVGLALVASGVLRSERDPPPRALIELGLASLLLSGPLWSFFS